MRIGLVAAFVALLSPGIAHAQSPVLPGPGLTVASGGGAALSLDGSSTGAVNTAKTSVTTSLTTANPNDIIGIFIVNSDLTATASTVSSITATGGTGSGSVSAFTSRKVNSGVIGTQSGSIALYWASATSALTGVTLTVTMSSVCDTINVVAFGVTGAGSLTSPFDSNGALPASAQNLTGTNSKVQTTGVSTSHANDMLISGAVLFSNSFASMPGPATGWTDINTINNSGTAIFSPQDSEEQIVAATQSSITVGWKTGAGFDASPVWLTIADAIQGH